jgi:chromosome segregation ATPase
MFVGMALKNILGSLGIKGIIMIILMIGAGIVVADFKHKNNEITKLESVVSVKNGEIATLNNSITAQNASIDAANKLAKKAQDDLNAAEASRIKINNSYQSLKNSISNKPLAKNCQDAVAELSFQNGNLVKKWNGGLK